MNNSRKILLIAAGVLAGVAVVTAAFFPYKRLKPFADGLRPALVSQGLPLDLPTDEFGREIPDGQLTIAEGFQLRVFTRDTINPRVLVFDQGGRLLVSEPSAGRVSTYEEGKRTTLLEQLNRPHGLAFDDQHLYVAETGQVLRYDYDHKRGRASNRTVLLDLPSGGRHWTRTIGIGPDKRLYITVGSSCNICEEEDWRRTTMLRYDLDSQELITYATGLRNAVYFTWQPDTDFLFATEMGRDWLGNEVPPDELNIIDFDADYGYPFCYGDKLPDPQYNDLRKCVLTRPSLYDFRAHEAPLGLDFLNGDLFVALHGSWNSPNPVGYEVIRLTKESRFQQRETVISGWLRPDGKSTGRPAGVTRGPDNRLYISDDASDIIYVLSAL